MRVTPDRRTASTLVIVDCPHGGEASISHPTELVVATVEGDDEPRLGVEAMTAGMDSRRGGGLGSWVSEGPARYGKGPTALYCDFENLVLGAGSAASGVGNPVPTEAVTWLCRWYGNASIRRAYADWADVRFSRHQAALRDNNIDLIHIPRLIKGAHKNAADLRLAVDAMETLMTHPEVGVFILIAGDSDYTPPVGRLRKTTVVERLVELLVNAGVPVGGFVTREVLGEDGRRVGFKRFVMWQVRKHG